MKPRLLVAAMGLMMTGIRNTVMITSEEDGRYENEKLSWGCASHSWVSLKL